MKLNSLQETGLNVYSEKMIYEREIKLDDNTFQTNRYISIYGLDRPMDKKEIVVATESLLELLNINEKMADFICEIMADEKWSSRKFRDAVKYVVKTHHYKEVKPADILQYDKGIRIFDWEDTLETSKQFKRYKIPGLQNYYHDRSNSEIPPVDLGWYVYFNETVPDLWELVG